MTSFNEIIGTAGTAAQYIAVNYPTKALLISGGLCAVVAAEAGIRAIVEFGEVLSSRSETVRDLEEHMARNLGPAPGPKRNLGKSCGENFWTATLFGICASNALPGLAITGAIAFTLCAAWDAKPDSLLTTRAIHTLNPVVKSIAEAVWNVTKAFFETVGNILSPILRVMGSILREIIPTTPTAFATVALALIIIAKKVLIG